MNDALAAIPRGFRKLTQFAGRDARAEFWPYATAVVAVAMLTVWTPSMMFSVLGFIPAGLVVALLAAAVTRRLHDRGRSGRWAVVPVVLGFLGLSGFAFMPWNRAHGFMPNVDLITLLAVNGWVFLASLAVLILILAQRGATGPNRYGEAKERATDIQPVSGWDNPG